MRNPFKRSKPQPTPTRKQTHAHVTAMSPETHTAVKEYWKLQKREQRRQLREQA